MRVCLGVSDTQKIFVLKPKSHLQSWRRGVCAAEVILDLFPLLVRLLWRAQRSTSILQKLSLLSLGPNAIGSNTTLNTRILHNIIVRYIKFRHIKRRSQPHTTTVVQLDGCMTSATTQCSDYITIPSELFFKLLSTELLKMVLNAWVLHPKLGS